MSSASNNPGGLQEEVDEKVCEEVTTFTTSHTYFGVSKTQDAIVMLKRYPQHHFYASKSVLSAFSEGFYAVFNSGKFVEKEQDTVQLDFKSVTPDDFTFFLEWVYGMRDLLSLRDDATEGRFLALAEIANMYDVQVLKVKLTDKAAILTKDLKWAEHITKDMLYYVAAKLSPDFGRDLHALLFSLYRGHDYRPTPKPNDRVDVLYNSIWQTGKVVSWAVPAYSILLDSGGTVNQGNVPPDFVATLGRHTK